MFIITLPFSSCANYYSRSKTLKANVAVSAPIMSRWDWARPFSAICVWLVSHSVFLWRVRFDLFFVILDECNPAVDEVSRSLHF
jgi:hypothetical protein